MELLHIILYIIVGWSFLSTLAVLACCRAAAQFSAPSELPTLASGD